MKKIFNLILIFIFMLTINVKAGEFSGFFLGEEECIEGTACEVNGTKGKMSYDGNHTITIDNYTGIGIDIYDFNNDIDIIVKGENEFTNLFLRSDSNADITINGEKNSKIVAINVDYFISIDSENSNSDLNISNVEIITNNQIVFNENSYYNINNWEISNNGIDPEINNGLANGNGKVARLNNEKKIGNLNIKNCNMYLSNLFYGVGNIIIENSNFQVSPISWVSFITNPIGDEGGYVKFINSKIELNNEIYQCATVFYCVDAQIYITNSTIEGYADQLAYGTNVYIEDSNIDITLTEYFANTWGEFVISNSKVRALSTIGEDDFIDRNVKVYFYDSDLTLINFDNIVSMGSEFVIENCNITGEKIMVFVAGDVKTTIKKSKIYTEIVCGFIYGNSNTGDLLVEDSTIYLTSPKDGTQDGFVIKYSEAVFKNSDIVLDLDLNSHYSFANGFSNINGKITFENTYLSISSEYAFHSHSDEPNAITFIGDYKPINSNYYEVFDSESNEYIGYFGTEEYTTNIINNIKTIQNVLVDKEEYSYEIVEGDKQELNINNLTSYSFKIDGNYLLLDGILFDGVELVYYEDYIPSRGSTIITFTQSGLNKIKNSGIGKKEFKVYFVDNETTVELYLADIKNPQTGDNLLIYILLSFISFLSVITISKRTRKI